VPVKGSLQKIVLCEYETQLAEVPDGPSCYELLFQLMAMIPREVCAAWIFDFTEKKRKKTSSTVIMVGVVTGYSNKSFSLLLPSIESFFFSSYLRR
jgi:hypothetical protein